MDDQTQLGASHAANASGNDSDSDLEMRFNNRNRRSIRKRHTGRGCRSDLSLRFYHGVGWVNGNIITTQQRHHLMLDSLFQSPIRAIVVVGFGFSDRFALLIIVEIGAERFPLFTGDFFQ